MFCRFTQKLNAISTVLVLMLFGTVCSSYAIDCMELWDEESIAEVLEDRRRYQESLRGRQLEEHEQNDEDNEDEDADDDHDDDHDDHMEEDDEDEEEHHGVHATTPAATISHQDQRHKRHLPLAAHQPAPIAPGEDPSADLEVAESHLFRPVFRYKSQYTERRRV